LLKKTRATLVAAALSLLPVAALADPMTDWSLLAGGTYSWNGSTSSGLVGTNIPSTGVLGGNTPLHNGSALPILNGYLNFVSGAYNGTGSNWSWGAGGVLNLTGCIPGVTAAVCTGSNNVALLSDDFQSVQIVPVLGSLDMVFGNITGTINQSVANYFGVPNSFSTASFITTISTIGSPGHAFSGANILGAISANPPPVSAAEFWGIGESLGFAVLVLAAFGIMIRLKVIQPFRSQA
jgi:hypothetical protein